MPGRQGNRGSHLLEEGGGGGRLVPSSQPLVQPHRPGCLGLGGWGGWFQPPTRYATSSLHKRHQAPPPLWNQPVAEPGLEPGRQPMSHHCCLGFQALYPGPVSQRFL